MEKKIFVICSVRGTSDEYKLKLESYVKNLEKKGFVVHLPHRDTDQKARGFDICKENANAIVKADEVHIFYNSNSQGTHFDMGVAFALNKPLVVVENETYGEGKSYPRMIDEWANENLKTDNVADKHKQTDEEALGLHRVSESLSKLKKELKFLNKRLISCKKEDNAYGVKIIQPLITDCEIRIKALKNSR